MASAVRIWTLASLTKGASLNFDRPMRQTETTACDKEPIHLLGSVQPHGFLLAFNDADRRIVHASANVPQMLGRLADDLTGQPLEAVFPEIGEVPRRHSAPAERAPANYLGTIRLSTDAGARSYDVASHRSNDLTIVEFEEVTDDAVSDEIIDPLYLRLNGFVEGLQNTRSLDELCHLLATDVRHITDFDRALVYRFDADWHGTVVAEDRNDALPSYHDLRFPASDIPSQARELYRRNRLRIIPDAGYAPVPIRPQLTPVSGAPLDLSQSILRSVSPVHVEYMRNMGTMASMSVSILIDGALWGLISCHNREPRRVPLRARKACALLTRIFALQLTAL